MVEQAEDSDVVGSDTTADELQAAGCVEARWMVAFDFFGFLTMYDGPEHEILAWIEDPTAEPTQRPGASELVQAYRAAGYEILYFHTAPTDLEIGGRPVNEVIAAWLQERGFPVDAGVHYYGWDGVGAPDRPPEIGITDELIQLSTEGVSVEAGYTRSESRAHALGTGGVPVERIFVVGPQAGTSGTTAIPGDDLVTHAGTVPGPVGECAGG